MKYNQYLELENLLNENNLSLENVKENPDVLNEIGVGLGILGAVAGGLGFLFRKHILSWGIKSVYIKRLNAFANKFEKRTIKSVSKLARNAATFRQSLVKKEQELRSLNTPEAEAEKEALKVQKQGADRKTSSIMSEYVKKQGKLKSEEVYKRIDGLKGIKESHKIALKSYWETLIININFLAQKKLIDEGIITDPTVLSTLKQEARDQKATAEENLRKIRDNLKEDKKEDKEKNMDDLYNDIEKLDYEKGELIDAEFIKKLHELLNEVINFKDKEEAEELFAEMKRKFGEETLRRAMKKTDSSLEPEDDL